MTFKKETTLRLVESTRPERWNAQITAAKANHLSETLKSDGFGEFVLIGVIITIALITMLNVTG